MRSMNDIASQLTAAINDFVAQIADLARQAAFESVQLALGREPQPSPSDPTARRGWNPGRKVLRRSTDDLASLAGAVHAFVAEHPGLRIGEINKRLGTSTKALARPVRQLVAEGSLKKKGVRRSTVYFAADRKPRR